MACGGHVGLHSLYLHSSLSDENFVQELIAEVIEYYRQ